MANASTAQVVQVVQRLTPYLTYLKPHWTKYRFHRHSHLYHCLLVWRTALPNNHRCVQKWTQESVQTWQVLLTMLYLIAYLTGLYHLQVLIEINLNELENINLCAVLEAKVVIINQNVAKSNIYSIMNTNKYY